MNTALRISLVLAALPGFASAGFGQGSMSRFTTPEQIASRPGKSISSPSTNGFTISAQRHFDNCVDMTVCSATRYWFQDISAPSESLVAAGRFENATLWAQASPAKPGPAFPGNGRTLQIPGGAMTVMAREYRPGYAINRVDGGYSHYDEGQLAVWIQKNVRFARVDPVP
jgi:hypothetical protein